MNPTEHIRLAPRAHIYIQLFVQTIIRTHACRECNSCQLDCKLICEFRCETKGEKIKVDRFLRLPVAKPLLLHWQAKLFLVAATRLCRENWQKDTAIPLYTEALIMQFRLLGN